MTYILGISAFYHDSAATLIKNGTIISAAQEERFTRKKHDSGFPKNSINFVLNFSRINLKDIDHIVFYEKPFLKFERLLETYVAFAPKGYQSFSRAMPIWLKEKLFQKKFIFDHLKSIDKEFKDDSKLLFSEHHLSHAASAFYPSPFEEAIILTADGVGEWATTTVALGKKNKLEIKKELHFPHSLGLLYSAFTYYTGFKVNSGEYKLMGLAPYGSPKYVDKILDNLIDLKDDGTFMLDQKYFNYSTGLTMTNENFNNLFGEKPRKPDTDKITQFHMDIAASIQKVTEEIMIKLTKAIRQEYNIKNLCLAGGVALNCVANGKILQEKIKVAQDLLHPVDWSDYKKNALKLLPACLDNVLQKPDGKRRYCDTVLAITKAFALCGTMEEAMQHSAEVAFHQAIRAPLIKTEKKGGRGEYKDIDFELKQLISESLVVEDVADIFKAALNENTLNS